MRLRNYARMCKGIWSSGLVYNFLIQLFSLKSLVFVVHFLNVFWHGNEIFPKGSSQNEIFPLLVVFHLPYSKYNGVKICFYSCRYQNQNFPLVLHSCRQCCSRVAFVSLMSHSCSKLNQIITLRLMAFIISFIRRKQPTNSVELL